MPSFLYEGQTIDYQLKRRKGSKHLRLKIDKDGLSLSAPIQLKETDIQRVLLDKGDWILKQLGKYSQRVDYRDGRQVDYLGRAYTVQLMVAEQEKVLFDESGFQIFSADLSQENISRVMEKWYRKRAKVYLPGRVEAIASEMGIVLTGRIVIKNQKTRWGSCSSKGNINLNLRLMMAPEAAIDYVIIHELCHLWEMNHSAAFWKLVAKYAPDYQYWRVWFRKNTQRLYL